MSHIIQQADPQQRESLVQHLHNYQYNIATAIYIAVAIATSIETMHNMIIDNQFYIMIMPTTTVAICAKKKKSLINEQKIVGCVCTILDTTEIKEIRISSITEF